MKRVFNSVSLVMNLAATHKSGFTLNGQVHSAVKLPAGLYLVATPIGNLGDITIRALETMAGCDVIACEDTRTSGVLLKRYGIDRPKVSYTEHNAAIRGPDFLRQISEGKAIALISDAGTPLVSDPGFRLVESAVASGICVVPVPGASAPLAALVGSGLSTEEFKFCGFLPSKEQARRDRLKSLAQENCTLIFFESPTRLRASLNAMAQVFDENRKGVVARELTKMHETFHRGSIGELKREFAGLEKIRGEIVIVLSGAEQQVFEAGAIKDLLEEALLTMKTKSAASQVSQITGLSKQELYKQALAIKDASKNDEK